MQMTEEIKLTRIGRLRRLLFVPWPSRWNAFVRDTTAAIERWRFGL